MFSGTIFSRAARPPENARLPRSCWAFFQHVDSATTVDDIARKLDLSDAEAFAAIRLLQSYGLIEEDCMTFAEFQNLSDGAVAADESDEASDPASVPESTRGDASGDGVIPSNPKPAETAPESAPETGSYSTDAVDTSASSSTPAGTRTQSVPVLDLTSFWKWLEGKSGNVKNYKNTQAFILMEASGALSSIGVESMDALEAMEECGDPDVIEALEQAVENNMNETIPESCYK